MQTVKTALFISICLVLLGACGNKGPLYIPAEQTAVEADPETEGAKDKDDKKKKDTLPE